MFFNACLIHAAFVGSFKHCETFSTNRSDSIIRSELNSGKW